MKKLKIFLALLLALTMVLSMVACGGSSAGKDTEPAGTKAPADDDTTAAADDTTAAATNELDWLNIGGVTPIVDEGVEKTLSLVLPISDEFIDGYQDRWQYIMCHEVLNINLEVQPVPSSAWGEKLPLILADAENLPDLIMKTGWGTGQLLRYGAQEGLIVDIAPYINEQYMPCLASLFSDHPAYKIPWTDAEGHVWGVGIINHMDRCDEMQWHFLNYDWMEDCGLDPATDLPETLDEFTELMRLFKEVKSAEFGEEIYPIAGKYTGWNAIYRYLLIACGFVGSNRTDSWPGGDINMRNGKVTLPVADREGWTGFVTTLAQWYEEGLVHPEYITGDSAALDALISADKVGYVTVPPVIWVGANDREAAWWGAPALTSEWCETPGVPSNAATNGSPSHVITTACEELELALAFYDWFFQRGATTSQQNYFNQNHGPYIGTDLAEKYPQFVCCKETDKYGYKFTYDYSAENSEYIDANNQLDKVINLWGNCVIGYRVVDDENGDPVVEGNAEKWDLFEKYDGTGVKSWVELDRETRGYGKTQPPVSVRAFLSQYQVATNEEFPAVVYFDAETQERVDDLKVTLKEYSMTETAKFITGERPLEELTDYFDEMDALGAQEYIQYHQEYFDAVVGG